MSAEEFRLFAIEETDETESTLEDAKDKILSLLSDEHKDQLASLLPSTQSEKPKAQRAPEEDTFIHRLLMGLPPLDFKKSLGDDGVSAGVEGGSSPPKKRVVAPILAKSTLMRPGLTLPDNPPTSLESASPSGLPNIAVNPIGQQGLLPSVPLTPSRFAPLGTPGSTTTTPQLLPLLDDTRPTWVSRHGASFLWVQHVVPETRFLKH